MRIIGAVLGPLGERAELGVERVLSRVRTRLGGGRFFLHRFAVVVFPERIKRRSRTSRQRQRTATARFRFVISWFFHC